MYRTFPVVDESTEKIVSYVSARAVDEQCRRNLGRVDGSTCQANEGADV